MITLKRFVIRLLCRHRVIPFFILLASISLYVFSSFSPLGYLYRGTLVQEPFSFLEEPVVVKATARPKEPYTVNVSQKIEVDVVKKLTIKQTNPIFQKKEKEIEYIQAKDMDLRHGDMPCKANESCRTLRLRTPEQAKVICNSYGPRCKGFVYSVESGMFFPKEELKNKVIVFEAGFEIFVKKAFAENVILQDDTCAVPLDQLQPPADGCRLPVLDPNDEGITARITIPKPLRCPGFQLTRYRRGVLELTESASKVGNISSLTYQPIFRPEHDDWGVKIGNEVSLQVQKRQFKLNADFIRVQLTTAKGAKHVEYHAQIVPRSPKKEYSKVTGLPLSVVIIGFDSLSAAHFQRALPEAYKFMKEEMNSVFLKGYSIVGDATTPAMTAFVTGKFESELPEARRRFPGAGQLDRWPHIFKDFKTQGYTTLFSEDCPGYGAFNYRLHGFKDPPTDHYARYFWSAARITSQLCVNSKPQHQIHFDYIKSFLEAYRQQPKFGLFFMTDISHNSLSKIYLGAKDFSTLLRDLSEGNILNDTLLIVMSDHGVRTGEVRATLQGKLEERLPLMSFTFPKWFSQQYPDLVDNLKDNSNVVTSPFDLYATFRHLLNYPQTPANLTRGDSLFSKISPARSCEGAGVAEHYCPCVQWKGIDTGADHARRAAQAVVDHVNNLTASDPLSLALCSRLQLEHILAAHQKIPNVKLTQYLGSSFDYEHGSKPMFSKVTATLNKCLYQVQLQTLPGKGIFEAPVSLRGGIFQVTGEISRINLYGEQPRCILDKSPHLRKYCLCKDYKGE